MDHHTVEQRYRQALYKECRYLRTEGLLEAGLVSLNSVFVMQEALRSERERPEEGRPALPLSLGRAARAGLPGREAPPVPVAISQALQETQHLVLLGEPGAGKTTTLQFIALCFVHRDGDWVTERLKLHEDRMPVWADLRALAPSVRDGASLTEALVPQVKNLAQVHEDVAQECPRAWRREGQLLLLLDGLDEVSEERETVRRALRRFANGPEGGNCRVVVSSRTAGYADLGAPYREYALRPFGSAEEAAPYVAGWLAGRSARGVLRRRGGGRCPAGAHRGAKGPGQGDR